MNKDLKINITLGVLVAFILGVLIVLLLTQEQVKFYTSYIGSKEICEKDLPRNEYCDMVVLPTKIIRQLESE